MKQLNLYIYIQSFPSWIFKGIAVLEFKTLRFHLFPLALPRLKFSWVLPWQAPLWRSKPKAWNGGFTVGMGNHWWFRLKKTIFFDHGAHVVYTCGKFECLKRADCYLSHLHQVHFLTLDTTFATYFHPIIFLIVCRMPCSSPYFRDNFLTFSGLLPAHFFLWARHPLQVALSPLNIPSTLCPLHLQHCFFSTFSMTISPHAIPCFLVDKCPPHPFFKTTGLRISFAWTRRCGLFESWSENL